MLTWPKLRRRSGYRVLAEIKPRLTCRRCGQKPRRVALTRSPMGGVGPGGAGREYVGHLGLIGGLQGS